MLSGNEAPDPALRAEAGSRMRRARENRKITPHQAARQFRVSPARLRDWETGRRSPGVAALLAMVSLYRVSADSLLARHSEEQFQEDLHLSLYRRLDPGQRRLIQQMAEGLRRAQEKA